LGLVFLLKEKYPPLGSLLIPVKALGPVGVLALELFGLVLPTSVSGVLGLLPFIIKKPPSPGVVGPPPLGVR
jgi:hypothetical protein